MDSVAIFGANGFVGKKIYEGLVATGKYTVTPVTRDNYQENVGKFYNIIINSAMPGARFWAQNNPDKDFIETVQKTANLIYGCKFDKFVQISTLSARCQLDTIYGRHKLAAEKISDYGSNLIFRLGAMFGDGLKKGVLVDMLKGQKVFVSKESRYNFCDVAFIGSYIASHLDLEGIIEIGAFNTVCLADIAEYLNTESQFSGQTEIQEIQNPIQEMPDAKKVYEYLDKAKSYIIK
ncbi:MAG TPA: NAD(P)-dependent oxidoreductase [Candidatus Paceibacterota bacterium]